MIYQGKKDIFCVKAKGHILCQGKKDTVDIKAKKGHIPCWEKWTYSVLMQKGCILCHGKKDIFCVKAEKTLSVNAKRTYSVEM